MSLKTAITDILKYLAEWEKVNLNEAQTRQAIILRILAELGFNIWQPFEIFAEESGSSGNYRPDFVIRLQHDCFIIEAKALNKNLGAADAEQAINYVNTKGLRWAILTNGKHWKFFDNDLRGAANQRLAFEFSLQQNTETTVKYFEQLLSPKIWRQEHAAEQVANNIRLIQLQRKLSELISWEYTATPAGLQKAIRNELSVEEQTFAREHLVQLAEAFNIDLSISPTSTVQTPQPPQNTIFVAPPAESVALPILQQLAQKIDEVVNRKTTPRTRVEGFSVKLEGLDTAARHWKDLHAALVELLIESQQRNEAKLVTAEKRKLDIYGESGYYLLSNQLYLRVHYSIADHLKHINRYLKILGIPNQTMQIFYKADNYLLPN